MVFKATRLDEITVEISLNREEAQGLSRSTPIFRGCGDEEEPATETEKECPVVIKSQPPESAYCRVHRQR